MLNNAYSMFINSCRSHSGSTSEKRGSIGILILAGLGLAACASPSFQPPPASTADNDVAAASGLISEDWPAGVDTLSTTAGDIYLANLNSQIRVLDHRLASQQDSAVSASLAGMLYHRFQLLGRVEDAVAARDLLQHSMERNLLTADELLVYARILSGLHEFDTAERVITAAAELGANPPAIEQIREQVTASRQLPSGQPINEAPMDYVLAVQQAARLLEQGHLTEASQKLQMAQQLYHDSSPFPLAWIHLQQGVAFLRYQQYEQARVFFEAAHERLPQYYLATEHLAETEALLGNWQRSAELYRQVTAQTDQPAFWHGLHQAEAELGNMGDAERAAQLADDNYRELLEHYPLTFADHAVSYYLETGREQRALELAELNFDNRQDVTAQLAMAEALAANGQQEQACAHLNELRQAGLSPPEIIFPEASLAACTR